MLLLSQIGLLSPEFCSLFWQFHVQWLSLFQKGLEVLCGEGICGVRIGVALQQSISFLQPVGDLHFVTVELSPNRIADANAPM